MRQADRKIEAALREVEGRVAEIDMPLLRSLFDSWLRSTNMSPLTGLNSRHSAKSMKGSCEPFGVGVL